MTLRTCIKRIAHERALTVAEVAKRAGVYRSNLSAMDAGRRGASLQLLARIARVLSCEPGELLEGAQRVRPLFAQASINKRLRLREAQLIDGSDCSWVHANLLAWQRHYRSRS